MDLNFEMGNLSKIQYYVFFRLVVILQTLYFYTQEDRKTKMKIVDKAVLLGATDGTVNMYGPSHTVSLTKAIQLIQIYITFDLQMNP